MGSPRQEWTRCCFTPCFSSCTSGGRQAAPAPQGLGPPQRLLGGSQAASGRVSPGRTARCGKGADPARDPRGRTWTDGRVQGREGWRPVLPLKMPGRPGVPLSLSFLPCAEPCLLVGRPGWGSVQRDTHSGLESSARCRVGRLGRAGQCPRGARRPRVVQPWPSWLGLRARDHDLHASPAPHLLNGHGRDARLEGGAP